MRGFFNPVPPQRAFLFGGNKDMNKQISDLEYTIPSGDFDKFYEVATGNTKYSISMNDIRRCLLLFYNMKVMNASVDDVYKQYKRRSQ